MIGIGTESGVEDRGFEKCWDRILSDLISRFRFALFVSSCWIYV